MKFAALAIACLAAVLPGAAARGQDEPTLLVEPVPDEAIVVEQPAPAGEAYLPSVAAGLSAADADTWRGETVFDVLFLQRNNATDDQPITLDATSDTTLFTTRSTVFATAPGVRLFHARRQGDGDGWEIGYWGLYGMFADARADLVDGLAVPGLLGSSVPGWSDASTVQAGYSAALNVAEFNLFTSDRWCTTTVNPRNPRHRVHRSTTVDWIGGLFWAGLDETAFLRVTTDPGEPSTAYRVATTSNLFGAQVGVRGRRQWRLWALEGWWKVGLGGSWLGQSASPITSSLAPGLQYRTGRSAETTNAGFLSTMNVTAVRRLGTDWSLRAGYNLAWLSGVALAPNQYDFTDTSASGRGIEGAGGLFLHGASLGLERRW